MPFVKRANTKTTQSSVDLRKIFIGRTTELHFFIEYILTPEDPLYNVISISGEGGVGKSTLIDRFIDEMHSPHFREYCLPALVDAQQATPFSVMEKFAQQLSEAGTPLPEFGKALARYKETLRKLQVERESVKENAVRETIDIVGTVAEEVPFVGGILHKSANIFTDLYLKDHHIRQMLKDAALLENPINDLTSVFIEELNQLTDKQVIISSNRIKRQQRIVLFFDTFEQLADEVAPWLLDHFLQASISTNIIIVIAGRDSIEHSTPKDPKRWLRYRDQDILYLINLNSFTEDETRAYLAERGITDLEHIATIWQLSKGLPLYLGLLTFNLEMSVDPTADVVANFLRWIPEHEPVKRQLALNAALFSRPFNQDDLTAFPYLPKDEQAVLHSWFFRLPFVRSSPLDGRYRYHELAQEMFRRHLYQRSQQEYYAARRALATYYQRLLSNLQEESVDKPYAFTEYMEIALALAYQLFYLPDEASHIIGIENVLNVYRRANAEQKKENIRFLRDLPFEQQSNNMSTNGLHLARHLLQFLEARAESQQQNLVEAASELIKNVIRRPGFSLMVLAWIHNSRGNAYRDLKEYQRAIQDFDHAIEIDPDTALYYLSRGLAYRALKEYQRAIQDFDRAIDLDPNTALYYNNRGLAYQELKKYQQAIQDFDHAIEIDPDMALYYLSRGNAYRDLKEYQRAIQDFDHAIEIDPASSAAHNNRGIAYWKLKENHQAIQDYNRAIGLNPTSSAAHNNRGLVHNDVKEYQRAIQDFDHAIDLDPDMALYYRNRGNAYRDLKEYQRAIQDFDHAIEIDPDTALYYLSRGLAYRDLKEYQRAIQDFDRAIDLNPTSSAAHNNRGNAYSDLKEYQRAIQDFDHAIDLDPDMALYYRNRGNAYGNLKDYQQAIQNFDRAIDLDPDTALYYLSRGNAYGNLKEYQRTIRDFDRAIDLDPAYVTAYINRSEAYRLMGNYEYALSDIDYVLILEGSIKANTYNKRGLILSHLGRYEEAIKDYDRGLKEEPDNIYIIYNIAVVMARWKGMIDAQLHIATARDVLLALNDGNVLEAKLYGLGGLAALVHQTDQALAYLRQAILQNERVIGWARHDIAWVDLRSNPRFQEAITGT